MTPGVKVEAKIEVAEPLQESLEASDPVLRRETMTIQEAWREVSRHNEGVRAEFREAIEPKRLRLEELRAQIGKLSLDIEACLENFLEHSSVTRKKFQGLLEQKRALEAERHEIYLESKQLHEELALKLEDYPA